MSDYEWCKSICRVNGPALRTWLERFAPRTGATQQTGTSRIRHRLPCNLFGDNILAVPYRGSPVLGSRWRDRLAFAFLTLLVGVVCFIWAVRHPVRSHPLVLTANSASVAISKNVIVIQGAHQAQDGDSSVERIQADFRKTYKQVRIDLGLPWPKNTKTVIRGSTVRDSLAAYSTDINVGVRTEANRGRFPKVLHLKLNRCQHRCSDVVWEGYRFGKNPSSFICPKVSVGVSPLTVSYYSVGNSGQSNGNTQEPLPRFPGPYSPYPKLPPWGAIVCAIVGFIGAMAGGIAGKHTAWSGPALVVGVVLWTYGMIIVLPWSVS